MSCENDKPTLEAATQKLIDEMIEARRTWARSYLSTLRDLRDALDQDNIPLARKMIDMLYDFYDKYIGK